MWKLHRLPESMISDRGPQSAAWLTKELNKMLGIETKLSMAYHPQIDRQTERTNQKLEQYLRMCHKLHSACIFTTSGSIFTN